MIPPAPRSARLRAHALRALAVTATASVLAGCAAPSGSPRAHIVTTDDPGWSEGLPSASPTPPPATTSSAPPVPPELAWWLDRLPRFGPAPQPQPVSLSRPDGLSAMVSSIPTTQPVAFLTIDDGWTKHPYALEMIKTAQVPITLFLTTNPVAEDVEYFRALQETGYVTIHNHTVSHLNLQEGGYAVAQDQLCGANNRLEQWFGVRPRYFRPPGGNYDDVTRSAAWACGLQAGFMWKETITQGLICYQRETDSSQRCRSVSDWQCEQQPDKWKIQPGDIILMHFRPEFPDDLLGALLAIKYSGLVPARLEDYVRVTGADPAPAPALPAPEPGRTPSPDLPPHCSA